MFQYLFPLLCLIIFIIILISNPYKILNNHLQLFIFFSCFLFFLNLFLLNNKIYGNNQNFIKDSMNVFILFASIIIFYYICNLILNILFSGSFTFSLLMSILNLFILIGFLSLLFLLLTKFNLLNNVFGINVDLIIKLIINIVFYIPCLFIDAVDFFRREFLKTKKVVWIIFIIEIILILLRVISPYLYTFYNKYFNNINSKLVEEGPIYTNNLTNLGIFQDYENAKKSKFKYNFALSCWIWINPQPESTNNSYSESAMLLNYGDIFQLKHNNNKIEVLAATTENKNLSNNLVKVYDGEILYQRWNNYIFNYFGGTLDIFINNKLVVSIENITPILKPHRVFAGQNNGIHGGIKEIKYYSKSLNNTEIDNIYNNYI